MARTVTVAIDPRTSGEMGTAPVDSAVALVNHASEAQTRYFSK
jgi:hypothetical protein